jgi:hypothetical protein
MDQLAERWFVELVQDVDQLRIVGMILCEACAVSLAQGRDQRIAVLARDLPVLISVAVVEAWLFQFIILLRSRVHLTAFRPSMRLTAPSGDAVAG